jgi:hypothetical protein
VLPAPPTANSNGPAVGLEHARPRASVWACEGTYDTEPAASCNDMGCRPFHQLSKLGQVLPCSCLRILFGPLGRHKRHWSISCHQGRRCHRRYSSEHHWLCPAVGGNSTSRYTGDYGVEQCKRCSQATCSTPLGVAAGTACNSRLTDAHACQVAWYRPKLGDTSNT